VEYRQVEQLFDMMVEYFHTKPPPAEHDAHGEWVKVRDGLQGVEHCIRVLTPDEFDDWHRCIDVPIEVEAGRQPVAFCSHEGAWWVIYADSDESEVISRFEKCFEGPPAWEPGAGGQGADVPSKDSLGPELCRFDGIVISLPRLAVPPSHFQAMHGDQGAEFSIVPPRWLKGDISLGVVAKVVQWAGRHEQELLEAWEDHVSGQEPRKIEP
jgi:hypothetical protein